jgi:DNA-binding IclR family transcriptional regulator
VCWKVEKLGDGRVESGGTTIARDHDATSLDGDSYVRALDRGLSILGLFDVEHPRWTVGSICEDTGLRKATVYRMVRTLESRGLLSLDRGGDCYRLGRGLIPQAYLVLSHVEFAKSIHHFLRELAQSTGETAELAIDGREGPVVVDQVGTSHPFKLNLPIGRILPGTANAPAKLFSITRSLGPQTQAAQPPETVLAYDLEETDSGVCAVSAPVYGAEGELVGAVTLVVPSERFRGAKRKKNEESLRSCSLRISAFLGYQTGGRCAFEPLPSEPD